MRESHAAHPSRHLPLQVLYSVRSERILMEQLDRTNLSFRWFVGLNMDDLIWDATLPLIARTPQLQCA